MKTLDHLPLYASALALQLVTVFAIALERMPATQQPAFILAWGALLAGALTLGYRGRRWSAAASQWVQLLPFLTSAAAVWLWLSFVGPRILYLIAVLGLLAGRNALLATRRSLYLDLGIVLAAFYDTIGARGTEYLWPAVLAFIAVLMFVLMSDYADRRLAYVRTADAEAREALAPSVRNALLATVLVVVVGALIYALLPQPGPRGFGIPDPDARDYSEFGAGGSEGKGQSARAEPGGQRKAPVPDPKGRETIPSRPGGTELAFLDISRGGGDSKAKLEPHGGGRQAQGSAESKRGDGKPVSGGQQGERGAGGGSNGDSPGSGPRDVPEGTRPVPSSKGPQSAQTKGATKPEPGASQGAGDRDSSTRSEDESRSKPEGSPAPRSGEKREPRPAAQPLVLALVDARNGLYVRTHAFARLGAREWLERDDPPAVLSGPGRFVVGSSDDRDALVQHYRIKGTLAPRILAGYRAERLSFPATSIGHSADHVLLAGGELRPDTRYSVVSTVQFIDARPTGSVEPPPVQLYLSLPESGVARVAELAASVTRGKTGQAERAAALEAFLRKGFTHGPFDAGKEEPLEAFLFTQRRGGAEQFASALAMMLRTAGIPSRIAGGYRVRRLNPLHGDYELWEADRHYWVEAYVDDRWTLYEPSPWASLPGKVAPPSSWSAAQEYVRLAKTNDWGAVVQPPLRPTDGYLRMVLAWGWAVTFGPWLLLGLLGAALVAWQYPRWLWPLLDTIDLMRLRRGIEPRLLVLASYQVVERGFGRRGRRRNATENHAEYLGRMAEERPHLARALAAVSRAFSAARYGDAAVRHELAVQAVEACRDVLELADEMPNAAA